MIATGNIYKITNKINNKIYIGQTIMPINQRFSKHKYDALKAGRNTALCQAIRKNGIENFKIELIEKTTLEKMLEREVHWIKETDSMNREIGYNRILESQRNIKKYDQAFQDFLNGKTTIAIEKEYHLCRKTFVKFIKENGLDPSMNNKFKGFKTEDEKFIKKVVDSYENHKSSKKVAKELKCCTKTVLKILHNNNIL